MYTAFNLKIGAEYFNDFDDLYIKGTKRKDQLQKDSKTELEKFITSEGLFLPQSPDHFQQPPNSQTTKPMASLHHEKDLS